MRIVLYANPIVAWQKRYSAYFREGFKRHGLDITIETAAVRHQEADIAVLLGPNYWKNLERSYPEYLMVNRKFLGDVNNDVAIGWNGLNGRGQFCVRDVKPKLPLLPKMKNWRQPANGYVLLLGQADLGRCGRYFSLNDWYNDVQRATGDEMLFRAWPGRTPMVDDTRNAKVAVSLNSTAVVETIINGVPTVAYDEGSPAYAVCPHNLGTPHRNWKREPWLEYLMNCQHHYTEIQSGAFWNQLWPRTGPRLCDVQL